MESIFAERIDDGSDEAPQKFGQFDRVKFHAYPSHRSMASRFRPFILCRLGQKSAFSPRPVRHTENLRTIRRTFIRHKKGTSGLRPSVPILCISGLQHSNRRSSGTRSGFFRRRIPRSNFPEKGTGERSSTTGSRFAISDPTPARLALSRLSATSTADRVCQTQPTDGIPSRRQRSNARPARAFPDFRHRRRPVAPAEHRVAGNQHRRARFRNETRGFAVDAAVHFDLHVR